MILIVRLPNIAVLFLILTMQQSCIIEVSSVPEGLEELVIETRKYGSDLFTLYFKSGFMCTRNDSETVAQWCESLNARRESASESKRICTCACQDGFRTFLPQKLLCVNSTGAANFGGKREMFLLTS